MRSWLRYRTGIKASGPVNKSTGIGLNYFVLFNYKNGKILLRNTDTFVLNFIAPGSGFRIPTPDPQVIESGSGSTTLVDGSGGSFLSYLNLDLTVD
jgi:hypothetical protein